MPQPVSKIKGVLSISQSVSPAIIIIPLCFTHAFCAFYHRLNGSINESDDVLAFMLKIRVIESLRETSSEFKYHCILNEANS